MYLETNLSKIKQKAAEREDENFRFRAFLKSKDSDKVDKIVHQLHKDIAQQIDCKLCGNCCIQLKPRLNEKDITTLAQLENVSSEKYMEDYCENDFGDIYLKNIPCRYNNEKKCSIYENRPTQCGKFPYTDEEGFTSRSLGMIGFYEICPIVYNLMERMKVEIRFRR